VLQIIERIGDAVHVGRLQTEIWSDLRLNDATKAQVFVMAARRMNITCPKWLGELWDRMDMEEIELMTGERAAQMATIYSMEAHSEMDWMKHRTDQLRDQFDERVEKLEKRVKKHKARYALLEERLAKLEKEGSKRSKRGIVAKGKGQRARRRVPLMDQLLGEGTEETPYELFEASEVGQRLVASGSMIPIDELDQYERLASSD